MEMLFKKDSKGKVLQWQVIVKQDVFGVHLSLSHGEYGGNIVTSTRNDIKGKNKGKTNETTPLEQANADALSLIKRRKRLGYKSLEDLKFVDNDVAFGVGKNIHQFLLANLKIDTTDLSGNLKPMKAQQYYRASNKPYTDKTGKTWDDRKYFYLLNPHEVKQPTDIIIKFPALIQPKINGVRCTVSLDENNKVQLLSKEGLKYNLPIISQQFEDNIDCFTHDGKDIIFDGELYIHGELLQTISSAVKSSNFNTPRVEFICFDLAIPDMRNIERIKLMKVLLDFKNLYIQSNINYIPTYKVSGDKETQAYTDRFIKEGYEGSILRATDAEYGFGKRPMTMVKLKRCMTREFNIVGIKPQDKNPNLGLFTCITTDGKEFDVTPKGNNDFKELILFQKELYIGKPLSCTFYEFTEKGLPLHVIDNCVRDYE